MLLILAEWLAKYHSGFDVFRYLTLRTILGVLTALFIALMIGPKMIHYLAKFQIGQIAEYIETGVILRQPFRQYQQHATSLPAASAFATWSRAMARDPLLRMVGGDVARRDSAARKAASSS